MSGGALLIPQGSSSSKFCFFPESQGGPYHLSKDASQAPDVDSCGVELAAQEDLWSPVPERHHLRHDMEEREEQNHRQSFKNLLKYPCTERLIQS